ncbi:hypothetical protein [Methanobrevibacter sp.]|uniref:hypothetical protein n=1 Tax=Methanobrevibacter sp. TaxID=66852 RepID=UPI0026F702AC|nr:hypothetical protein [Methanobrevibacter sp.]
MIEDNIRVLRQAAKLSTDSSYKIEKSWCVLAGNAEFIDEMAYKAIASNHNVKILFREHVILNDGNIDKKFDFLMLYGNSIIINEYNRTAMECGGAYVKVSPRNLSDEKNVMVFIAPQDTIKDAVSTIEKSKIPFAILQDSQTTGFIDVDFSNEVRLPNFIKSALKPFYNANEVVLSTLLISVDNDDYVEKVQSIATSNRIFVIDFKDIVTED